MGAAGKVAALELAVDVCGFGGYHGLRRRIELAIRRHDDHYHSDRFFVCSDDYSDGRHGIDCDQPDGVCGGFKLS
jgi:hypothetical protein